MKFVLTEDEMKHNIVVRSGFEFVEPRPMGFFEFDDESNKNILKQRHKHINKEFKGKLKIKEYGFEPNTDDEGNLYSDEQFVISRAKTRRVLIFQNIEFCKEYHNNIFIIPIQTLKKPKREKYRNYKDYKLDLDDYKKIIGRDEEFYDLYYFPRTLPNGNIYHRALRLSDARFVHKTMIFEDVKDEELKSQDLRVIGKRLGKMLNIEEIEKCEKCMFNSEKEEEKRKLVLKV